MTAHRDDSTGFALDATHDPARRSWVTSANQPGADFPIQNLPFAVFSRRGESRRVGVALGDALIDVSALRTAPALPDDARRAVEACAAPTMNALMACESAELVALRRALSSWYSAERAHGSGTPDMLLTDALISLHDVGLHMPADVGDYTDFYASIHHATNVGRLFRPDQPLLPNYQWVPIGYHGRASSIVASGTPVRRPCGQRRAPTDAVPTFAPSASLDYELEVGAWVRGGNPLGTPIPIGAADAHLFGISLLNDWSARDVQAWEYQPLGPFLGKSFATSVSPFVVTREALAPFRVPLDARDGDAPAPLPYLTDARDRAHGGLSVTLEVWLSSRAMREQGMEPMRVSYGALQSLYWTFAQMIAHHSSNGCNLRPGDLLGSGTVSGASAGTQGCLLELTRRGAEPITLPDGSVRRFLEDGDEVILRGHAAREGAVRIGLGECRGVIEAASGHVDP